MAAALAAVACCTLSWTDAHGPSDATRAIPEGEQAFDPPGLAELDETPRLACDGSKSSWPHATVAGLAVPVGGDARGLGCPREARTSIVAYRYTTAVQSRAPPQRI